MASKPDYIDIDKDGNKRESMKAAAKQAKKKIKVYQNYQHLLEIKWDLKKREVQLHLKK